MPGIRLSVLGIGLLMLLCGCGGTTEQEPESLPICSVQVEDLCHRFTGPVAEIACDRPMLDLEGECSGQQHPISCKAAVIGPTSCQPVNADQTVWCCLGS